MKQKAFTLAEVLITLAIIGVVAALTIPSVISNYQQQEFKTGLKKAVNVLNDAIQMNILIDGQSPYVNKNLYNYLTKHMNVVKKIYNKSTCYDKSGNLVNTKSDGGDNDSYRVCSDMGTNEAYEDNNVFYTADGMRFELPTINGRRPNAKFILHESGIDLLVDTRSCSGWQTDENGVTKCTKVSPNIGCGSYGLASNPNKTTLAPCIVMVDVNGDKKPNPPQPFVTGVHNISYTWGAEQNQSYYNGYANQPFTYSYPSISDKKLSDVFNIMITENRAIPFGVVAQRAMYSK